MFYLAKPPAIPTAGASLVDERLSLGTVTFDAGPVVALDEKHIFVVPPLETKFFDVTVDMTTVIDERDREQLEPCPHDTTRRDLSQPRRPGDVFLLVRIVRPDNGQDYIIRELLSLATDR